MASALVLDVPGRRVAVRELTKIGMSTRAIAPVVGVQHSAVAKDLRRAGVSDGHTSPEPESLDEYRGRVLADAEATGKVVRLTAGGTRCPT